jgi:hypothetical protein
MEGNTVKITKENRLTITKSTTTTTITIMILNDS